MRMRPVRHFSRALHQVSACVITSARHSQVRSPNMRTSQHIVAGSVRVVHICSSKSWLTRTNATGRNDLQTAKTLIPRKNHAADMPRYTSCTETQRLTNRIQKAFRKTFFLFEMSMASNQQNNKSFVPTSPGGRARLFFFFLFIYFI